MQIIKTVLNYIAYRKALSKDKARKANNRYQAQQILQNL